MSHKYAVFRNRNRVDLPIKMLLLIGASDDRDGNTGQGFGTKMSAASCLVQGLEFVRSSHDEDGAYIARFVAVDEMIRDKVEPRIALDVERRSGEKEVYETGMLVRMARNGWATHPLGDDYSIVREIVLDAADEDRNFEVGKTDTIEFAPSGWTYTYITLTPQIEEVVDCFDYYFKDVERIKWVSSRVGITASSAEHEARCFLMGESAPLAYAAWNNLGGDPDRRAPEAAYDYVLIETESDKLASLPKRVIERETHMRWLIFQSMCNYGTKEQLAAVFRSVQKDGWEADAFWWGDNYWEESPNARAAMRVVTDGKVIGQQFDAATREAIRVGKDICIVDSILAKVADAAGMVMAKDIVYKDDRREFKAMTNDDRIKLELAWGALAGWFGEDFAGRWRDSHIYYSINGSDEAAIHNPSYGGSDVIGIRFTREPEQIARSIVHELGHHLTKERHGMEADYHDETFSRAIVDLVTGAY